MRIKCSTLSKATFDVFIHIPLKIYIRNINIISLFGLFALYKNNTRLNGPM